MNWRRLTLCLLVASLVCAPLFAAAYAQPEDKLVQGIDAILHGKLPPNDEWTRKGISDLSHDPRQLGPSANWFALAEATGCWLKSNNYCAFFLKVLKVENDSGQGETATDDGHSMLRVYGLYAARIAARNQGLTDLEAELDAEILQKWALELLTDRYDPGAPPMQHQFITAAQRPIAPDDGSGRMEILFARGANVPWAKMPLRWQKMADRVYDNQFPFTVKRFAEVPAVAADLIRDHDRLTVAWMQGGWPAIGALVKTGSRCELTFLRFPSNGYVSTLAKSCGLAGYRWVAMSDNAAQSLATQFPNGISSRQAHAGSSLVDVTARTVTATDAVWGKFSRPFPGDPSYGIKLTPNGVSVFVGALAPPPIEPPPVVTPPPVKPPSTGCGSGFLPPSLLAAGYTVAYKTVRRLRERRRQTRRATGILA